MKTIEDNRIILGIETCTNICSVALWDGQQMHSQVIDTPRSHSKSLIPMIERVLDGAGLSINVVQAIACARGPGSFTGVRIGVGVAKGLAFGQDITILPISPLQAIAYRVMQRENAALVTAMLDARMGELYVADYANDNGIPTLQGKERLTSVDAIHNNGQTVAGTGVAEYHEQLLQHKICLSNVVYPYAEDVVMLARYLPINPVSATDFVPLYLRDKVTD